VKTDKCGYVGSYGQRSVLSEYKMGTVRLEGDGLSNPERYQTRSLVAGGHAWHPA
jgi:hypothetical protein